MREVGAGGAILNGLNERMLGIRQKVLAYLMIGLAGLLGGGSLVLLAVFLVLGPVSPVDLGMGEAGTLFFDACLSLAFFIQHSGMVRKGFRRWSGKFVPSQYQSAVYAIASGVVLLAMLVLWQESSRTIWSAGGILRWMMRALFLLGLGGFYWTGRALGSLDPLGVEPMAEHLRGRKPTPLPLTIRGPYRWVRHPFYSCCLLLIWSYPDLTADRLVFNVLWTVWIVIGAYLEEQDLMADFGDDYREYRRKVPMLLPLRGRADIA